ncbi:double-strand break repair protein AddB [Phenylobacterium sp.]|uniref:double-strand break repair protein AddB n=1 Tax=Phenylobacterium sp. TaxID=1871053 RepID=UPI0027246870|nr:double-strand break repair protein AddB [Phenylobacterium sp.]MDO8377743.1 double-strand break repair protein AddB [Phenylobacterium sp.]
MIPLLAGGGPRWFNIPAHRPFVHDLARGLFDALSPLGPQALSQAVVLTPTRRGARALADAFIAAAGGRAVLPPQIRPLGDLDEGEPPFEPGELAIDLPAAIDPLRRRFELIALVKGHEKQLNRDLDASAALELADALGSFLDSLQIEEVSAKDGLADLVSADLAEHWRVSREFLETALVAWPARLRELGVVDVSQRRVALLRALAEAWDRRPPEGVLIAAGSTGTAPATADLLAVIARAPQGCVILPGLDESLAEAAWAQVGEQHPQGAMKRLLARSGASRQDVVLWPASDTLDTAGRWRRRVINEALRPAEATADWLTVIETLRAEGKAEGVDPIAAGLEGLSVVTARAEEEAATVAALLLREALETPGMTAALVAPDQTLARRVAAKLARWGVGADSSAGSALAGCRCGVLAALVARAASDPLDPVTLLAIAKHPFVRLGLDPETLERRRAALELYGLRGPRQTTWEALDARLRRKMGEPRADLPALEAALAFAAQLRAVLARLQAPYAEDVAPPAAAARALAETMEALAADAAGDAGELWAGHGGEALGRLLSGLMSESDGSPAVSPRGFADLLARLMSGESIRSGGATHPRLRILGAIEARLTRADRLIVAGLEEGVWPQGATLDPFLSRPMREALGLPPPERRVGLAAHDFAQAACAPEVILLHSERREGAPAVKSRWLWRLETLARGAGVALPARPEVLDWARSLDAASDYTPAKRPAPRPPVADRPREMAVTRVEALTRDPYAVWARDILRLYPLERPDEAVEARARGTAIHKAFERFAEAHPVEVPADAAAIFEAMYVTALEEAGMPHEALARESALAREAALWVADLERRRRADGRTIHVELKGELEIMAPGGLFKVNARADRIELSPDGYGHILDYKTGKAPSQKVVDTGFSPQLTLTAAILAYGGFPTLGRPMPGDLTYLEVTGRKPAGREEVRAAAGEESEAAARTALDGLGKLVARFDDPAQPYLSRSAPQFVKTHISDYDHLARVFEWSTSGDEEGE